MRHTSVMDLTAFRLEKDQFFVSRHSPLPNSLKADFKGLQYFGENTALRFSLLLEPDINQEVTIMQTSNGSERVYQRLGWITFPVKGSVCRLALFVPEGQLEATEVFIPFRDSTSGNQTYGAGRYLEAEIQHNIVQLDFNLAYNPYCAYADGWACPVPPLENWLQVAIEAGEKTFGVHHD